MQNWKDKHMVQYETWIKFRWLKCNERDAPDTSALQPAVLVGFFLFFFFICWLHRFMIFAPHAGKLRQSGQRPKQGRTLLDYLEPDGQCFYSISTTVFPCCYRSYWVKVIHTSCCFNNTGNCIPELWRCEHAHANGAKHSGEFITTTVFVNIQQTLR